MSVNIPHVFRMKHSETRTTNASYGEFAAFPKEIIHVGPVLGKVMKHVDLYEKDLISDLEEAVAIKSVSNDPDYEAQVGDALAWAEKWLRKLDFEVESYDLNKIALDDPCKKTPALLANTRKDPGKRTICLYGFVDVRSPDEDNWATDPWKVVQKDKKFYGNGVASSKGILLCWFHAIQMFQRTKTDLPVNIKFVVESMHFTDSAGLDRLLHAKKLKFFADVTCVVSCIGEWIGERMPCLIYGTVGISIMDVIVEQRDNSDIEEDMKKIIKELYDPESEKILIPKFNDAVKQITPDEEACYEAIRDFDIEKVRESLQPKKQSWGKIKLLMHFWRLPNMQIGEDLVVTEDQPAIKRQVILKLVQNQVMEKSEAAFAAYVVQAATKLGLKSKVSSKLAHHVRHWSEKIRSWHYLAGRRAVIQTYKEEPSYIREDRAIPSISAFDVILEKSILILPLAGNNSNIGEENENIRCRSYFEGTKLLASVLVQLSEAKIFQTKSNI